VVTIDLKTCSVCGLEKDIDSFYKQKKRSKKNGEYIYYNPECKECTKQRSLKWHKDNPEKAKVAYVKRNRSENWRIKLRESSKKKVESGYSKKWQNENKDKLKIYNDKHRSHAISDEEWKTCKEYFNYSCAYCGLPESEHYIRYSGKTILGELHKEHVVHAGENDISNCVPSCRSCNSSKRQYDFEYWFKERSYTFNQVRLEKVLSWIKGIT
jgi:hypothetical protein